MRTAQQPIGGYYNQRTPRQKFYRQKQQKANKIPSGTGGGSNYNPSNQTMGGQRGTMDQYVRQSRSSFANIGNKNMGINWIEILLGAGILGAGAYIYTQNT